MFPQVKTKNLNHHHPPTPRLLPNTDLSSLPKLGSPPTCRCGCPLPHLVIPHPNWHSASQTNRILRGSGFGESAAGRIQLKEASDASHMTPFLKCITWGCCWSGLFRGLHQRPHQRKGGLVAKKPSQQSILVDQPKKRLKATLLLQLGSLVGAKLPFEFCLVRLSRPFAWCRQEGAGSRHCLEHGELLRA